jgi:hypothetical protein
MRKPSQYFQTLLAGHPFGTMFTQHSKIQKEFMNLQYDFKKNLLLLIIKTLKPDVDYKDPGEIMKFFNAKNWLAEKNFEKLMIHAETICQGMAYLETLRILSAHTKISEKRIPLFQRYSNLVRPRLDQIYSDWKYRS